MPEDVALRFAVFPSKNNPNGTARVMSWDSLCDRMAQVEVRDDKDGEGWVPAEFAGHEEGLAVYRQAEQVQRLWLLVLDNDDGQPFAALEGLLEGLDYLAHTTFSHTEECPRYRVVVPLAAPVERAQWPDAWRKGVWYFTGGRADPRCKDPSRFYWLPSSPAGVAGWVRRGHGRRLDLAGLPEPPPRPAPRGSKARRAQIMPELIEDLEAGGLEPEQDQEEPDKWYIDCIGANYHSSRTGRRDAYVRDGTGEEWGALAHCSHTHSGHPDGEHRYGLGEILEQCHEALCDEFLDEVRGAGDTGGLAVVFSARWLGLMARLRRSRIATLKGELRGVVGAGLSLRDLAAAIKEAQAGREERIDAVMEEITRRARAAGEEVIPVDGDDLLAREWAEGAAAEWRFCEGDQWWRYVREQQRWMDVGSTAARVAVQEFMERRLGEGVGAQRVRGVVELAQRWLGITGLDQFDANRMQIPLANGVYDVTTGELLAHGPERMNTSWLPYDYDPAAVCSVFEGVLREWLIHEDGRVCEEWVTFMEEWLGYLLIPYNGLQTLLVNVGAGGNGKGVFTRLVAKLVGSRQATPVNLDRLGDYYTKASLQGKLVGFINEPSRRAMEKGGHALKEVSGGDPVQARNPREKVFWFQPHIRFIVSCNELPDTSDLWDAYFRRIVIVQWRYKPAVPDQTLDERLERELSGIFNAALRGLARLAARGWRFEAMAESDALKREYRMSQDHVALCLDEILVADPKGAVTNGDMYAAYQWWCKSNGYMGNQVLNSQAFGMALNRLGVPKAAARWNAVTKQAEKARLEVRLVSGVGLGAPM